MEIQEKLIGISLAVVSVVMILLILEGLDSNLAYTSNAQTDYLISSTTNTLSQNAVSNSDTVTEYNNTWLNFTASTNVTISDNDQYSPSLFNNETTISFWIYMDDFDFKGQNNNSAYVNFFRKTEPNIAEWQFRMYNETGYDSYPRPCRISFYAYNETGGTGAGSYFQDNETDTTCKTQNDTWIHIVGRINGTHTAIFKNGVLRDADLLSGYGITLNNTNASIKIGTDQDSQAGLWEGYLDEIRIYNRSISNDEITEIYNAGRRPNITLVTTGLVSHFKLNENNGSVIYDVATLGNDGTLYDVGWINDGITNTLTRTTDYTISHNTLTIVDTKYLSDYLTIVYTYYTLSTQKTALYNSIVGFGKFNDFVALLVIAVIAVIVLGIILTMLKRIR